MSDECITQFSLVHFFSVKETNQRKHALAICFILHLQTSKGRSAAALRYFLFSA